MLAELKSKNGNKPEASIEPAAAAILDDKIARRNDPPYLPATQSDISLRLQRFINSCESDKKVANLNRIGGGASKEQFVFDLVDREGGSKKYVLRIDPSESVVATARNRESEILNALADVLPVPRSPFLDANGQFFGQPAIIMAFIPGVTRPTQMAGGNVTGMNTKFDDQLRGNLTNQFLDYLKILHAFDWRRAKLPSFTAPLSNSAQAGLWQYNWWARVWREDKVAPLPIMAVAEAWMAANLPYCEQPVLLHCDFRTGNYLFDEGSGIITAILDWEQAHIGDYHEELAWTVMPGNVTVSGGRRLCSGLLERDELIMRYEQLTGRNVDRNTLHFYEVLGTYRAICITLATSLQIAKNKHSHQDAFLTWLSAAGHGLKSDLCDLLQKGPAH